jgi:hypothetical protein
MELSFYIHYNGVISEDPTLFEMFVSHFDSVLNFKTQHTDTEEVFGKTLSYLKSSKRQNKDENFCSSISKGVPGMNIGYLRDIMRKPNNATLISYNNTEGVIQPMAILVFKKGNPTDEDIPNLYLDGMCSDQQSSIKGMGSQLLSIFIDTAKEVGFQFIELASASKKATETWKKKGFERQPGRRDHDDLPIYSLQLGGEGDKHVLIDLKHNNDILVCDETCKNLGPMPKDLDSLSGINNYINDKFEEKSNSKINKGGKKTKKHKTKKYKTKKHRTKKRRTK